MGTILRRTLRVSLAVPLFLICGTLATHALRNPFQFHQFDLARLEARYGTLTARDAAHALLSACSSGWSILTTRPGRVVPAYGEDEALFDLVFSWIPPRAVVYPTEGFYYWNLRTGEGVVHGNVRLADLGQGRLSMAYFTSSDEPARHLQRSAAQGLEVEAVGGTSYDVTWKGRTVRFRLPERALDPPRDLRLVPEEEFVGRIHDESGIGFFLLYNRGTSSFYDVLDEEGGLTDTLLRFEPDHLVGERTGFVFFDDREFDRRLLVGVDLARVAANDYLDGPGDQVPFQLDLGDKLYLAYPNTLFGDGVDEHGVYRNTDIWTRVAVSPFHRYSRLEEVLERSAACTPEGGRSAYWTALTKEWWNTPAYRTWTLDRLRREAREHLTEEDLARGEAPPTKTEVSGG